MKILKWVVIILIAIILLFAFVGMPYLKKQTKKISPERVATYVQDGLDMQVKYSGPYKKGRIIFGELVPFDAVWRTGANEPTTFTTKTNISILGNQVAPGTYSLWTIPGRESWTVMLNSEVPDWGVTLISGGKKTTYNPDTDVFQIQVPVETLEQSIERFTIDFQESEGLFLTLSWDKTRIRIPIKKQA
ncbi:DUF2911 domain-containing protein [Lentiprolixibacter aurantiacus]|uniref:DUF2911 domain-containing protein n=1 Tax=Lentiprolixibacter aurantiacus TaxID=2993939 RepID=A0AAE3MN32_9FLAO|nr:DUF2911 domain-containing protein [Lentiprolixibacter aurantiacus]MCX2720448.1 DUF2911 domain-containing protein [Lentiprolixibacter aurantiacus]